MSAANIKVRVSDIRTVAPAIREFTLTPVDAELPGFSAGSHVVVNMPGEQKQYKNAYSLLGDPADSSAYRIAVRLQEQSRGGSLYMHQQVQVGDELEITPPANLFAPLWRAHKHILIAGGVGITPFMSYLPELQRRGADFELHYCFRSEQTGAYAGELAEQLGSTCFNYDSSQGEVCNLSEILKDQPRGTHVYICGPQSLIEGVQETAEALGYPASVVHFEEFAAPQPGIPFSVTLQTSGTTIEVGADQSLLEALEASGIEVPNLCRGGVCGQCVTRVVDGEAEHRDAFLAEHERRDHIMPCVSRAKSRSLVLEL